ncbi:MAG: GGDEF domain-containing protein [Spirochaetia bacterium]|nr:GGDEF domain-containing protein [Spirochaetia bacterium]
MTTNYTETRNDTSEIDVRNDMIKLKEELSAICSILKYKDKQRSLVDILKEISKMAFSDEISGLPNRTYFTHYLSESIKKVRSSKESLAIIMINIDNFKKVNDIYGISAGDSIIEQFSKILGGKVISVKNLIREKDLYSRYGSDVFSIILPGATSQMAARIAERIRSSIANNVFTYNNNIIDTKITASFGVALFNSKINTPQELVEEADAAMYKAKKNGKNCVILQEE